MFILENVPLAGYSTMRLGGVARYLTDINTRAEISAAHAWALERQLPVLMIGQGSNIVWRDEGFPGLVMVNKILRFETFQEDNDNLYITVGAGEDWDSVVQRVVSMGYSGLEELSLIPGSTGATPVQNVGAYGQEVANVIATIEAYDTTVQKLVTIPVADCGFSYRNSRFKTTDKGRFFISAVTFHVMRRLPAPPFYDSLGKYFAQHNITTYTPQVVRDAVIEIRSSKLPDPRVVANNGSFFQNPIIPREQLVALLAEHPTMVYWELDNDQAKVSAAWMIESLGLKDYHDEETGMATWYNQPLVIVNESAQNTNQLLEFRDKIAYAVKDAYGIDLQQEPELLPE